MTIVLSTPAPAAEPVRLIVPAAGATATCVTADLREQLRKPAARPDAAAPLGAAGRWL